MTQRNCILALAIVVALASCGGTTTGPSPSARIEATSNPASITPTVCPPSSCGPVVNQLEALTTLTVRETGGVAGIVESVTVILRKTSDNSTLANATPSIGARFAANGSITIPIGVHYDNAHTTAATLTVTINARDDNQHTVTTTVAIPVLPIGG